MKSSLLIALAILPLFALGAEAHGSHRHHGHHRHFGHRHWHGYHRSHGHDRWHGPYRGHHHVRTHAVYRSLHDHGLTVPEGRASIYAMVTRSAVEHGLPPSLAHGIVRVESGYNCAASHAGAQGIMQVKAATARSVGVFGGLRSCSAGLEAGMRYLKQAYEIARGNRAYAATLYNRGIAARPTHSGYSRSVARMSSL